MKNYLLKLKELITKQKAVYVPEKESVVKELPNIAEKSIEDIQKIKDIASILGYYNPISFARLFKRHTGMTPGEYRFREVNKSKK